jgi:signal peptidase II
MPITPFLSEKMLLIKKISQFFLFLGGMVIFATIDQFLKHKIRQQDGFYVCNKGISFNISLPYSTFWIILFIFVFIICVCFCLLYKKMAFSSLFLLSLILIGGGTLSNVFDRLIFGCVVDYISLFWHFLPVFNLADTGIFLGSSLAFYILMFKNS